MPGQNATPARRKRAEVHSLEIRVLLAVTPPVLVYDFEDPATGTAVDNTGSGGDAYDGTLAGDVPPTFATAAPSPEGGQYLHLHADGGTYNNFGGRVDVASLLNPILGGSSTVAAYVRTSQAGHADAWQSPGITGAEQASFDDDIYWANLTPDTRVRVKAGDGAAAVSSNSIAGTWHHVVATRNHLTGQQRIYVDGVLRGSAVGETGRKGANFRAIGATTLVASNLTDVQGYNYLDGDLDQVQVYNGVLTPQEVAAMFGPRTAAVPAAPSGVSGASTGPASNTLTIPAPPAAEGIGGYVILSSRWVTGPFVQTAAVGPAPAGPTKFVDTAVTPGGSKFYVVRAYNSTGTSADSAPVQVITPISGSGATAEYFDVPFWGYGNRGPTDPAGGPAPMNRVAPNPDVRTFVPSVDFDYFVRSPDCRIASDEYSTVFTGRIVVPADADGDGIAGETLPVRFVTNTDDDGFLYVEDAAGAQVLASWDPGGHGQRDADQSNTGGGMTPVDVKEGGSYDFVLLQSEGGGGSAVHLLWDNPATGVREVVPESMLRVSMDAPAAPELGAPTEDTAAQVVFPLTDHSGNETRFDLYRDGEWVGTAPINAGQIVDPGPVAGAHSYLVRAVNTDSSAASAARAVTVGPAPASGAAGHYYNSPFWGLGRGGNYGGRSNSGARVLAGPGDAGEVTESVDFDYGLGSPVEPIAGDFHSTVWTGKVTVPSDGDAIPGEAFDVRFIGNTDDHGFYYVNGQLVATANYPRGQSDYADAPNVSLKEGQSYDFVVFQAEQGGGSGVHLRWVNPVTGATEAVPGELLAPRSGAPAVPSGFKPDLALDRLVKLRWTDASTSEVRYEVRRALNRDMSGASLLAYLPVNTTEFVDTIAMSFTAYYYQVCAINFEGEGCSPTLEVIPGQHYVPPPPTDLRAVARSDGIHLCFFDTAANEDRFVIERKLAADPDTAFADVAFVPANEPAATGMVFAVDPTAERGQGYSYRVRAENIEGPSAPSVRVNVAATPAGGTGLSATYYDERFFEGTTVIVSPENAANTFGGGDLLTGGGGNGGPTGDDPSTPEVDSTALDPETFSGLFEGYLVPEFTDTYTFYTNSDDGIDLKIIDPDTGQTLVSGPPDGINVLRGMGGGFADTVGSSALTAGKKYIFVGRFSENTGGAGFRFGWSSSCTPQEVIPNDALFPPGEPPLFPRPTDVTAAALCNELVTISFTDTSLSEEGYEVLRATSVNGPFSVVGTVSGRPAGETVTFVDRASATNPLAVNTTYFYQVRAFRGDFKGPVSAPVAVTTTSPNTASSDLTLNGTAAHVPVDASVDPDLQAIRLTDNINGQTGSFFRTEGRPVNRDFITTFSFRIPEGTFPNPADGFAFVLQSNSPTALGAGGGGLGYTGLPNSLAVVFDTYSAGGPINQTGVYLNGAGPTDAGPDLGFDLANGHIYEATITYDADASGDNDALTLRVDDLTDRRVTPFEQTFDTDTANGAPIDIDQVLGAGCAFVGFTGATGGLNQEQLILDWSFPPDYPPPPPPFAQVTQVFVNGPGLTGGTPSANQAAFRTQAGIDPVYGYPVPTGANQLKSIPWNGGVNQIALRFDSDVASQLQQGDLQVRGVNTASYTITNFSYDPATKTGVWTLSAPITLDKVRVFLDDERMPSLDGEWMNIADAYPSGDGRTGGDFDFRLNVLRGDATQDGSVNALDLAFVRQKLNKSATNPGSGGGAYSVFADTTADGIINALDIAAGRQRLNNRLPPADPASVLATLLA